MRTEMENKYGERDIFYATFVRKGSKRGWHGEEKPTLLFKDVRDQDGNIISDHLWFNLTNSFEDAFLIEGDIIRFTARVDVYTKGYERDDWDFKLSRPTKVEVMANEKFEYTDATPLVWLQKPATPIPVE